MSQGTRNNVILKDTRVNCFSVILVYKISEYLEIVEKAYHDRGGITGQRDSLKTSTALRIRKRMVQDIAKGALLPPVVIGLIIKKDDIADLENMSEEEIRNIVKGADPHNIAIIDGMQRTTAMLEAGSDILSNLIRVEYWISDNTNSLVYRMLVLNTGQVPWNLQRQIEVVFNALINELKANVPDLTILWTDDGQRRTKSGQYKASDLMELFLAFGLRKTKFKMQEQLADEFSRLDFIEATSDRDFTNWFSTVLRYLIQFDDCFTRFDSDVDQRFRSGRNIFDSQTARIGFVAAWAQEIIGRPGSDRDAPEQEGAIRNVCLLADQLINNLRKLRDDELGAFLALQELNELTSKKSGKVGEFEREFFLEAFRTLIREKFTVPTLATCWRAY